MNSGPARPWPEDDVILYDGVCVLCSHWVRFVAARDHAQPFRFTPISSPYGTRLAHAIGIDPQDPDTNAVILHGRALFRSDAALAVIATLPGWHWARALSIFPRPIRDAVYTLIARNRYRIFGQNPVCDLGTPAYASRVIV